jgi:AraC-like DNA-binding protein
VTRTQEKCNADGRGDISVALVLDCADAMIDNGRELRLRHGDLYVMDYSQPVRATRPTHRELALMLPRQKVLDVLGDDLTAIASRKLPLRGIGNLLRSHMRTAANEAPHLSATEQGLAIDAAADMALAALQAALRGTADADQVADGLYIAARATIERYCTDPEFSPDTVAGIVGCSRASLYRLFSRHGESVAAAIWSARLDRARQMLVEGVHRELTISDVAFRCGFLDPSSFSRMFKRRFGVTPREAREPDAPQNTWR